MVVRGTAKFLKRVMGPWPIQDPRRARWAIGTRTSSFGDLRLAFFVNERSLLPVLVPFAPAASVLARFPEAFHEVASRIGVDHELLEEQLGENATRCSRKDGKPACAWSHE
jgi:hypothetical protein